MTVDRRLQYRGPAPRPGRRPDVRRKRFVAVLEANAGNLSRTARDLGVSDRTSRTWYKEMLAGTLLDRL